LLVADCGGGTTDLNILRVNGVRADIPSLEQLNVVEGKAIGSTQIDLSFEEIVYERLVQADAAVPMRLDLQETAWSMMKSAEYLDAKCCFGQPDDNDFRVVIPNLRYGYSNPQYGIFDQKMHFKLSDLEELFDRQIAGLVTLVDQQLRKFADSHPNQQVGHLVLSGGLSNSAYVQRRLKQRYATNLETFRNTRSLKVHVSSEPQLAVCKGICFDKVKNSGVGKAVLGWRRCRASYGTDCKILYNPSKSEHRGLRTEIDPLDGNEYIMNGVVWFIRK
jgi:molecular chaperone DnaK (HSP70)